jgi:DNA helicase II / ATP-dependent DNA helicase PcrA
MELTDKQKDFMRAEGNVLVTGGPGSGKTTVAILKAAGIVNEKLLPGQKVLFLSFARATISRVIEAMRYEQEIPSGVRKQIEVETYHAFFWRIMKTHGYLVGLPRNISLLTPSAEAIALCLIRNEYEKDSKLSDKERAEKVERVKTEQQRLAFTDGLICFDLFAPLVSDLFLKSRKIRELVSNKYPVIILDEFQDTSQDQWANAECLGANSNLIALADPEQRIYDWIGADPERLDHFRNAFDVFEIDLSSENHRSAGTEIAVFANDVLNGKFKDGPYVGVEIVKYGPSDAQAISSLITSVYASRTRLMNADIEDWSIAILVPNKAMTRWISDSLRHPPAGLASIPHRAVVDMEAIVLSAEFIAYCLQLPQTNDAFAIYVQLICDFFEGRGGDSPTKTSLAEAANIRKQYKSYLEGKALRKGSIFIPIIQTFQNLKDVALCGNPDEDWLTVRRYFENAGCPRLLQISEEVKNVRLLERGDKLRSSLSDDWRTNGSYKNALSIVQASFVQEHFSMNAKPETGVVIMNMHKSKGKQFDEVFVFENRPKYVNRKIVANGGRFVRNNSIDHISDQYLQNLRVSITRGKRMTTIFTPKDDPSVLLP